MHNLVFSIYPGIPAFSDYKDKIKVERYEDFTMAISADHQILQKDIDNILSSAYRSYYLSPKWIIKFLKGKFFIK